MLFFILHKEGLVWGMEKFWKDFIVMENGKCFYREQCEYFIKNGRIEMYFDYCGIKLFNKFLFLEFLKILIRQNSVYWMITGKLFLLTRWELLSDRSGGNSKGEQRIVMTLISLIKRFLKSRVVVSSSWWRFWYINDLCN